MTTVDKYGLTDKSIALRVEKCLSSKKQRVVGVCVKKNASRRGEREKERRRTPKAGSWRNNERKRRLGSGILKKKKTEESLMQTAQRKKSTEDKTDKKKRTSISRPIYCELFGFLHVFDALLAIYFYLTKALYRIIISLLLSLLHLLSCFRTKLSLLPLFIFHETLYYFSFKNLTLPSKLFILSLRPYPRAHVISL